MVIRCKRRHIRQYPTLQHHKSIVDQSVKILHVLKMTRWGLSAWEERFASHRPKGRANKNALSGAAAKDGSQQTTRYTDWTDYEWDTFMPSGDEVRHTREPGTSQWIVLVCGERKQHCNTLVLERFLVLWPTHLDRRTCYLEKNLPVPGSCVRFGWSEEGSNQRHQCHWCGRCHLEAAAEIYAVWVFGCWKAHVDGRPFSWIVTGCWKFWGSWWQAGQRSFIGDGAWRSRFRKRINKTWCGIKCQRTDLKLQNWRKRKTLQESLSVRWCLEVGAFRSPWERTRRRRLAVSGKWKSSCGDTPWSKQKDSTDVFCKRLEHRCFRRMYTLCLFFGGMAIFNPPQRRDQRRDQKEVESAAHGCFDRWLVHQHLHIVLDGELVIYSVGEI